MGKSVSKISRQTDQLQQTARFGSSIQFFALSAFLYGQPFPNNIPDAEPGICGRRIILLFLRCPQARGLGVLCRSGIGYGRFS